MSRVLHQLGGFTMGTTWSVQLVAAAGIELEPLHAGIQQRLDAIVAEMSNWEADSRLSVFNRAEAGSWHRLPADFECVLQCALEIAAASDGAFDPTLGALADAWGFGPSRTLHPRDVRELQAASGWRKLQQHADGRWLQPGGLQLDLCAIAKGFAVDAVSAWLHAAGIGVRLCEVGGELRGDGRKPDGSPWRVLVEGWAGDERDAQPPRILALEGKAVATSGERWQQRAREDGSRYSHTLDPRHAAPLRDGPVAVSVVHDAAMQADGWATALGVLGIEDGFALAERLGIAARFIGPASQDHRERMTPAFVALLAA